MQVFDASQAHTVVKTVAADHDGQRVDNYLMRECGHLPKSLIYRLVRTGQVRVNGGRIKPRHRLRQGDALRVPPNALSPARPPPTAPLSLPVLWEDANFIAVDKPSGLAVHGGSGQSHGVIERLRLNTPHFLELAHRLDKGTSGVLLLAKKPSALRHLQRQWRARQVRKSYLAAVFGRWTQSCAQIDLPLKREAHGIGSRVVAGDGRKDDDAPGRLAVTRTVLLRQRRQTALLRAHLVTGRTHQLRVHLAAMRLPIIGDDKYGDFSRNRALPRRCRRLFLHAESVAFAHPDGESILIQSPPPAIFAEMDAWFDHDPA